MRRDSKFSLKQTQKAGVDVVSCLKSQPPRMRPDSHESGSILVYIFEI